MPRQSFPSKLSRETYEELVKVLERYGIFKYQLEVSPTHPAIVFAVRGEPVKFHFAGSTRSRVTGRVSRSNLAKLLKKMGLEEKIEVEKVQEELEVTVNEQVEVPPPVPPSEPPVSEPPVIEPPIAEPIVQVEAEESKVQAEAADWGWDENVVHFARDHQMLHLPLPPRPVLILKLTRDLVAEAGQHLLIDPNIEMIRVLSPREKDACFRLVSQSARGLREALSAVMRQPQTQPVQRTEVQRTQVQATGVRQMHKGRFRGVGLQLGRVLIMMDILHRRERTDKIDAASLAEALHPSDTKSISGQVFVAQEQGFIHKVGPIPGRRGYYYQLTQLGRDKAHELGSEPFTIVGQSPPADPTPMAAE